MDFIDKQDHVAVFFPGSTIGNLEPPVAEDFLRRVCRLCGQNGGLIIGIDLQKPRKILEAAYNDSAGVTAEFNLNLLARINRELGGDFNLSQFKHEARFNAATGSVEMHLRSLRRQCVTIAEASITVAFEADETIWTENSHKYSLGEIREISREAGFDIRAQWVDRDWPFAESLLVADME